MIKVNSIFVMADFESYNDLLESIKNHGCRALLIDFEEDMSKVAKICNKNCKFLRKMRPEDILRPLHFEVHFQWDTCLELLGHKRCPGCDLIHYNVPGLGYIHVASNDEVVLNFYNFSISCCRCKKQSILCECPEVWVPLEIFFSA